MSYEEFIKEEIDSVKELRTDFCLLRFKKVKSSLWSIDLYLEVDDSEIRYVHFVQELTSFCAYSLYYDYSKKYEKKC